MEYTQLNTYFNKWTTKAGFEYEKSLIIKFTRDATIYLVTKSGFDTNHNEINIFILTILV